jgi:DNA (cytosine-5)-methyltransferase 1
MTKKDNNGQQYICEKCGYTTSHAGHFKRHINNKKNPCVNNHINDLLNKIPILESKVNDLQENIIDLQNRVKYLESQMKPKEKLKYIDLFCGIGGFHQALSSLGCHCNIACDIDKNCRENYMLNYNIEPVEDVKKINPDELQDLDIICGGFPCQSFSNAGKKKSFNDDRGLLFDEIIRIAKVKKPRFMFLENVKHILKVDSGNVIKYIENKLEMNDYKLQLFNMSPHNYGIPQQRERIYFVCVRKDIYNGIDIKLPEIENNVIELDKFMLKKEDVDPKYNIEGDVLKCLEAWDEMIKIFEIGEKISPVIMINEHYNNHTEEEFNNYAIWRKQYITANKPLIAKYKPQWDKWYEKHKEILQKREIYGKLEWQVGKVKPNDSIFNYFIQIRQSGIRVKKPHYFPTLVAINQCPIYGKQKRYITPRECARLQSFPEDFKIDPVDNHAYKMFGNSVNCDNVKTVIKATFDHYGIEC